MFFTGSIDKNTGKSWCPDCTAAHPYIENSLLPKAKQMDIPFVEIQVGQRDEYAVLC